MEEEEYTCVCTYIASKLVWSFSADPSHWIGALGGMHRGTGLPGGVARPSST